MKNATLKITWSGKVELVSQNEKSIPSIAGVYEIQGRSKADGSYTRRYMGTSDNLKETYSKYLAGKGLNEKLSKFLQEKKSFFRYVKISDELLRKDLEKGLYTKYRYSLVDSDRPPAGSGKYLKVSVEENNI